MHTSAEDDRALDIRVLLTYGKKKMVKSNQCADYTKFQKLGITFKNCMRSIQALFSEASHISVNVSLVLQASIRFCEFGPWHYIKI